MSICWPRKLEFVFMITKLFSISIISIFRKMIYMSMIMIRKFYTWQCQAHNRRLELRLAGSFSKIKKRFAASLSIIEEEKMVFLSLKRFSNLILLMLASNSLSVRRIIMIFCSLIWRNFSYLTTKLKSRKLCMRCKIL